MENVDGIAYVIGQYIAISDASLAERTNLSREELLTVAQATSAQIDNLNLSGENEELIKKMTDGLRLLGFKYDTKGKELTELQKD